MVEVIFTPAVAGLLLSGATLALAFVAIYVFRRRHKEQESRAIRIQQSALGLAAKLIDIPPEALNKEIGRELQPLIHEFSLDRIKLFESPDGFERLIVTASQTAAGAPVGMRHLDLAPFKGAENALRYGNPVFISHIEELGTDFPGLKEVAESEGIRSFAAFPLLAGDQLHGILTFATLYKTKVWTVEVKRSLHMVAGIVGMALAHRRTEMLRRQVESRLRVIYDTAPIGLAQVSTQGRIMMVNPAFCSMLGYSAHELSERTWEQITCPEDRDTESRLLERMLAGEQPAYELDKRYLCKNGSVRWVTLKSALVRDGSGNPLYRISASQDISDRKAAEGTLRDSEAGLRLAMQAGRMFFFDWDLSSDVLVRSVESAEILGLPKHQNRDTGAAFLTRVHPEDRDAFAGLPWLLHQQNRSYQRTYRVVRPDERIVWIEEIGRGHFDASGRPTRIVGVAADITARREEELARCDWASRIVEFQEQDRARIARELHDDITQRLVLLAVTLERLKLHVPEQLQPMKTQLAEAWQYLHETTADLQRVSHELHSAKLRYLGLPAALQGLCQDLLEQKDIEVTFLGLSPGIPLDERTELALYRISQEALRNVATHSRARSVTIALSKDGMGIRLLISDDGIGFDTSRMQGKGLGLTSMKERLAMIGGTLAIQSAPGNGTTLEIRIPSRQEPA